MMSCFCAMLVAVLLTQMLSACADGSSLPQWKTQLMHFRKWEGNYVYQNTSHSCHLVVHSVQKDGAGGATVSFSAEDTELDMTAYSDDDISIKFKAEAVYQPGAHFYDGFMFVVELLQYGNLHVLLGNITHPASNFSTIKLTPQGSWMRNEVRSSDLSIGLAVGISVALLVVCTVIGIAILRWAIRKGYLRHVAMSYKNFRNPEPAPEPPVTFNNNPQQPDRGSEELNVHI